MHPMQQIYRHITEGEASMSKEEALKAMMLLSALESWAFSTKNMIPEYLHEDLCEAQKVLERIILEKQT
jgi:hypothetical protein